MSDIKKHKTAKETFLDRLELALDNYYLDLLREKARASLVRRKFTDDK